LVIRPIFEGVVNRLAARDSERLLRFVAEAEDLGGEDPFTPEVLEEFGKVVRADSVTYCEQDRVRQRARHTVRRADGWDPPNIGMTYWDIAAEHPVFSRHNRGDFRALKLSDFVSLAQLRRSRIYALWFGPAGIERELDVAIPSPPWHTKTFFFNRPRGRDFSERDRLVLDLLQPHLGRLWRAAQTRRRLRAAIAALDSSSDLEPRGLVLLASDGRIEFASPSARRLMREHFGVAPGHELPPALARWWAEAGSPTAALRVADCSLTIDRIGGTLLLEEQHDQLDLTRREREILAWVARGKTNPEIAETLWIAPTTVRRHLEHIYSKLGVHTRTAAAARLLGILNAEDRQ
jgi:DNA-binding CsgD family transcriptional regulator